MYTAAKNVYRDRVNFAKINTSIPIPNLIEIQKNSYERFLQMRVLPSDREDAGLQSVFKSVFPITDLRENCSLEFVEYSIGNWECKCGRLVGLDKLGRPCTFCAATIIMDPRGDREIHCPKCGHLNENTPVTCDTCDEPVGLKLKYDVDECQERGMTFAVPLKVTIRLVVWDKDAETGAKTIRDIKEQEVYFGDIPLMTDNGTFIINGTERVIVSQLHRSPGVFFDHDRGKTHSSGKLLFSARIIPYRGSWLDFEFDPKDCVFARIDRRRKLPVTIILRALGMSEAEILATFFNTNTFFISRDEVALQLVPQRLRGETATFEIRIGDTVVVEEGRRITARHVRQLEDAKVTRLRVPREYVYGKVLSHDVVNSETGEVIAKANEVLTAASVEKLIEANIAQGNTLYVNDLDRGPHISDTPR